MADLLLVDNDARIVELIAWFLERAGHRVRRASSYAQARNVLAAERERGSAPDLLLADLELGAERGAEELPRLSAAGILPPTLIVSGFLDADLERSLRNLPEVVGTLAKPFDMPDLEAAIARALRPAPPPAAAEEDSGWIEIRPGSARAGDGRDDG